MALHGGLRLLLALEHARGAAELERLQSGHLEHRAVRAQIALEHDEPAVGGDRPCRRLDDLAVDRGRIGQFLAPASGR